MAALALLLWAFSLTLSCSSAGGAGTASVYPRRCGEKVANITLNSLISGDDKLENDTVYRLLPGIHCLSNFSYVRNLSNITLSGSGRDSVTITCTVGVGLVFLKVSSLSLEGLTVSGCGIAGQGKLALFQEELRANADFFYQIHSTDSVAVAVGMVTDLSVSDIAITNTAGLGLLAVNALGSTLLSNSSFSLNRPSFCYRLPLDKHGNVNISEDHRIGGGAYFVFLNYNNSEAFNTSLLVQDTEFVNNSYCGLSAQVAVSEVREKLLEKLGYSLGAGGGLTVVLAQTLYSTEVEVTGSLFQNNTSLMGGGAYVALFQGAGGNSITFLSCRFLGNGLTGDIIDNPHFPSHGAGFYLVRDLSYPSDYSQRIHSAHTNSIILSGCSLMGNRGSYSAAVNVFSLYSSRLQDTVHLENCTLSYNEAIVGAAMHVGELKQNGLQPGIRLVLQNVVITKNKIYSEDEAGNIPSTSKSDTSAAVEFQAVNVTFRGESTLIADNLAGAVRSVSSVMYFHDSTTIRNNSGSFGGGLILIANSYVVLRNSSHLSLENNSAVVEGGAVYVNLLALSPDINYHDCFLFFEEVDTICFTQGSCSDVDSLNFTFALQGNVAPLGSLIFGSTLDTCPWSQQLRERFNRSHVLDVMYQDMSNSFRFSTDPTSFRAVTTATSRLAIHHDPEASLGYSPGELFFLNVSGYDHLNQSLPVLISSKPGLSHTNITSSLGLSDFNFLDTAQGDRYGDHVPVIVRGEETASNVTIYLYATDSYTHTGFRVYLTGCRLGFEYHSDSCVCELGLMNRSEVECNSTSMNLTLSNNWWAGPGPGNSSLVVAACISDFCSTGERQVKPPDFDLLCHHDYHRSGILCGQCAEGYSTQLGSHRCQRCGNNNGLSLIVLFAFGGIIIMFGILFLHITVSEGYLNSILFYTNILSVYIPILNTSNKNIAIFVVIAWLNLDFGIEQCFYDGMTTLSRVALHLVFPVYLLFLMLLVTLFSKKSRQLSWFFSQDKFSAAKLFATVLLMCYATLLGVCIELLSPISLTSVDGDSYLMWRSDPNQRYFQGAHLYLVLLACLLLVTVVFPPPILLIFPAIAFRTRLGVRIKPVLDAFWAPFKTKFRFFVGLRLLLRMIPYTTAYVSQQPMNILFLGVFAVAMLFLQVTLQPFQRFLCNILDTFLLSNVIVLVMGALYFQIFITANEENRGYVRYHKEQFAYFTFFVTITYVAILMVLLWHIQRRFPVIRRGLLSLFSYLRGSKTVEVTVNETTPLAQGDSESDSERESQNGEEMTVHWSEAAERERNPLSGKTGSSGKTGAQTAALPAVVNYSILREPLLEEGEADLIPANQIH